jgi:glycosyltransferase involved in cell wall biosynthesis
MLAELEWRKLRAYEGTICARFDRVTVVSEADRAALEQAAGGCLPATVIPIAVDTREVRPVPRTAEARHVLSIATMFYPPNVEGTAWFAAQVFPRVRRVLPDREFYVVGSRPPQQITRFGTPGSGIVVTGYVADLEPWLRRAAVLVVPLHVGSGMRVKILEAFARGIPVVSTPIGVEGIRAQPGVHVLIAGDADGFARAVLRVLRDPRERRQLAEAGRALVEAQYDWRFALTGLDDVYAATTGTSDSQPSLGEPNRAPAVGHAAGFPEREPASDTKDGM